MSERLFFNKVRTLDSQHMHIIVGAGILGTFSCKDLREVAAPKMKTKFSIYIAKLVNEGFVEKISGAEAPAIYKSTSKNYDELKKIKLMAVSLLDDINEALQRIENV